MFNLAFKAQNIDLMALNPGTLLHAGSYRIIRFIGQGGFGCTYEVEHVTMCKRMAMKEFFIGSMCNRDAMGRVSVGTDSQRGLVDKLREKFIHEARSVNNLNHPGIVRVTDVFEENDTAYFVMDYIQGESLQSKVDRNGPMPEAEAVGYIRQVCGALGYIHSRNILHLDIKPDNIMVDGEGHAILIDFGVSKQYDEANGQNTSTLVGQSPGYAPPEQGNAEIRTFYPATDIYALGATLYCLLTGTPPPSCTQRIAEGELAPLPANISPATCNAVYRALTLGRKQRPQTIDEFVSLLNAQAYAGAPSGNATKPIDSRDTALWQAHGPFQQAHRTVDYSQPSRQRGWVWAAAIGALLIFAAAAFFFLKPGPAPDPADLVQQETQQQTQQTQQQAQETQQQTAATSNSGSGSYGKRTFTANGVSFDMVKVPGAQFSMGATAEQQGDSFSDESPVHQVTLGSYMIGETEVTQELWQAVMGSNPSSFKGSRRPVDSVSWNDCQEFITRLNQLTGQHFRLPTEAEWEFAARGGNKAQNTKYSGSNSISSVAWYNGNSGSATHDVKGKQPNALGIYDMSGNVWEWCHDWYGDYSSNSQTNPTGPSSGSNRVLRGGGWDYRARYCRVSRRSGGTPSFRNYCRGLRLAL